MSWTMEHTGDGMPRWSGADSVYDVWWHKRTGKVYANIVVGVLLFLMGMGALVCLEVAQDHAPWGDQGWRGWYGTALLFLLGAVVLACAAVLTLLRYDWSILPEFITRNWTLSAGADGLTYRAGNFDWRLVATEVSRDGLAWSVALDNVTRVESAPTRQWQGARRYKGGPAFSRDVAEIPSMEHQVFLFLADGSRRVVHTVNGDPETASMLALSIRSWVEEQKQAARMKQERKTEREPREGYNI